MKPNVQRKVKLAPGRHSVGTSKVKKDTNRQKRPARIASGVLPFSATEVLSRQLSVSEPSIGNQKEITVEADPLAKIKLQLFPVDEVTRIGLDKDGLNPFLELTLRARKKISSVIKHINTKWGGSSIAIGELMLLPYDVHLTHPAMSRSWTLKDTVISAGDVYTAVQSPAIFRLSYGWFSDNEPQRISTATVPHNCINSESMPKLIETTEERKCPEPTTELTATEHVDTEVKMGHKHEWSISPRDDDITNLAMGGLLSETSGLEKISDNESKSSGSRIDMLPISLSTDISIGGLLSEASLQGKLHDHNELNEASIGQQAPFRWDDSITALSIGGLLSEASLQAKINNIPDPKSSETFISDSFDAIISSQVKSNPQAAKPSSLDALSSILDAEETCHAFAFRKFSSSNKNVRVSARASQDSSSNPFRFPHIQEDKKQVVRAEDTSHPEPKTELFPRPQLGEDSRSLGLRGLTWNESLGPFDLGNSLPWKG